MSDDTPLVTLGVPVHNGEAYLERALAGLRAQTYPRLEILVSDNASTDGTEAIARRAAADDPRVRYVRQTSNLGAARNFELLVREARGELFAWCAHDDERYPRFVEACVEELRRRPEAVLCNGAVEYLDEEGAVRTGWPDLNFETRTSDRLERALRLLDHVSWVEMYGLIRRSALLQAMPLEPVWGSDVVLSMKLLMLGDFAKVPEVLFRYRIRTVHKSAARIMKELVHAPRGPEHPYTEMIQALLRVTLSRSEAREERAALLWGFLRTLCDRPAVAPHPTWREVITREQWERVGVPVAPETLGRHALAWLAEALPVEAPQRGREALALALLGARRVLVVAPEREGRAALGPVLEALRRRCPGAAVALLERATADGRQAPPGVAERFAYPADAGRDARADLQERLRRWRPDLAVCLDAGRSTLADDLAAGAGAPLGIAVACGHGPARPGGPPSLAAHPRDRRWGFLVAREAGAAGVIEALATVDPRDVPAAGATRRVRRRLELAVERGSIAWRDATYVARRRYPGLYAVYRRARRGRPA